MQQEVQNTIDPIELSNRITLDKLKFSNRDIKIIYEPFCLFSISNYLDRDVYEYLRDSFPIDNYLYTAREDKSFFNQKNPKYLEFFNSNPVWKKFANILSSMEFILDMKKTLKKGLVSSRGWQAHKKWISDKEVSSEFYRSKKMLFFRPIYSHLEFSKMNPGQSIEIHTDGMHKLVSMLFHFPVSNWKGEYGGSTKFYKVKDSSKLEKWKNYENKSLSSVQEKDFYNDVECFHEGRFEENTLHGFIKSDLSYHSVDPIKCPKGITRNTLVINVDESSPATHNSFAELES